jgi:SAM-dependent methyltransferase
MDEIARANAAVLAGEGVVADYLTHPYHARRVAEAVDLLLRATPRRTSAPSIADLGAGSDAVSTALRHRGARVVMVDVLADTLGRSGGTPAVRADLSKPLPLRDRSLDGVFAGEIIEHLFDPLRFLGECRRVLVPGGVLVVTTPNLATLQDRIRLVLGRSPRQVDACHPYLWLHIRPFTASSLRHAFLRSGLRPTMLRSNYCVFGGDRRAVSSRRLAQLFPSLGGSLILAGVRNPAPAETP